MRNSGDHIKKSLQKRQEALDKFRALKESFLQTREKTIKDIEEARKILAKTMEQLPKHHFN
jgi:CRISPR/Cas system CSM-associated protein Csm5 (group 7 of RAMP superfamily)